MTGFFGEYDVANAAEDPFAFKEGTYSGAISGTKVLEGTKTRERDGEKVEVPYKGFVVQFTTVDNGEKETYDHYFSLPVEGDSDKAIARKRSAMRALLSGLEIPKEKMNTVQPDDLVGMECIFTVKKSKSGFMNLEVRLPAGSSIRTGSLNSNSLADSLSRLRGDGL